MSGGSNISKKIVSQLSLRTNNMSTQSPANRTEDDPRLHQSVAAPGTLVSETANGAPQRTDPRLVSSRVDPSPLVSAAPTDAADPATAQPRARETDYVDDASNDELQKWRDHLHHGHVAVDLAMEAVEVGAKRLGGAASRLGGTLEGEVAKRLGGTLEAFSKSPAAKALHTSAKGMAAASGLLHAVSMEPQAQTTIGAVAERALAGAARVGTSLASLPAAVLDAVPFEDTKPSNVTDAGAAAMVTGLESMVTGDLRGPILAAEAMRRGDHGPLMQTAVRAGDFWSHKLVP